MKKKFLILPILAAFLLSSVSGFASVGVYDDGVLVGQATDLNFSTGISVTTDGSTMTLSGGSVGSDGNFTSDGLALTADIAPSKFVFTASSGNLAVTGLTAGTGDVTLENGQVVDGGTNNVVKLTENSDSLSFGFTGSTITLDSSDGGFQFKMTDAGEGQVDFLTSNDADDYMSVKTVSDVPTIITTGTANLAIVPDGGTVAVTGIVSASLGLTSSSTITLQNSETIVNSTNNTVEVGGGTNTVLSVLDVGTSDSDAMLLLRADASADNGDDWRITSDGGTNSIFFENDTSGSQATKLTLDKNGIITTTNDIIIDGTTPQLTIGDATGQASPIIFEGATADGFETTLAVADATADVTVTIPATTTSAGVMLTSLTTNQVDVANSVTGTSNGLLFEGATADGFETTLSPVDPTADQTVSIANAGVANALMFTTLTTNTIDAANSIWGISNGVVYEGATANAFETTVSPADPTADQTVTIPNFAVNFAYMGSTLTTNTVDAANSVWGISNGLVFEGATADAFELTLSPADVGADVAVTLPTSSAAVGVFYTSLTTNSVDVANSVTGTSNGFIAEGATADASETSITVTDPTADRTVTVPNQSGVVMLTDSTVTALTPGAAITLTVAPGNRVYTLTQTDNADGTITFSGAGAAGDITTIIFTTTGAADEVITFHATLCSSVGTLTLGTTASHYMTARFISDGSKWHELSRTADQT